MTFQGLPLLRGRRIYPVVDGYMNSGAATTPLPFGDAGTAGYVLLVGSNVGEGGSFSRKALLRFPLAAARLPNPTLHLTVIDRNDGVLTLGFRRCLRVWDPATMCWSYWTGTTGWSTAGCEGAADADLTASASWSNGTQSNFPPFAVDVSALAADALRANDPYLQILVFGVNISAQHTIGIGGVRSPDASVRPYIAAA